MMNSLTLLQIWGLSASVEALKDNIVTKQFHLCSTTQFLAMLSFYLSLFCGAETKGSLVQWVVTLLSV